MSEIRTALRTIAATALRERTSLGFLDELETGIVALAGAARVLVRHGAMVDHADTCLAIAVARDAIDEARDRFCRRVRVRPA